MKVGICVEGASDQVFWNKVLHKHFRKAKFQIRNLKTKQKLIRETPSLVEEFKDLGYDACFIILDCDKTSNMATSCYKKVKELFEEKVKVEYKKEKQERFVYVCVAVKKIESWYLADEKAIQGVFNDTSYQLASKTDGASISSLFKKIKRNSDYLPSKKPIIAREMATKFNPNRALKNSASFRYFWETLKLVINRV